MLFGNIHYILYILEYTINLLHITGNNIKQIPIKFSDRAKGKSKIPKIEIFRTLINLFLIKFNFIKR